MRSGEQPLGAPQRGSAVNGRVRTRPDPRPARLMVGGGAVAALSLFVAGLARPPAVADMASGTDPADGAALVQRDAGGNTKQGSRVRYIRLKPGQKPPAGARVIQEAAPPPRVVVRSVPAPTRRSIRVPVARTRQSGG
jgi:hypothetical protein